MYMHIFFNFLCLLLSSPNWLKINFMKYYAHNCTVVLKTYKIIMHLTIATQSRQEKIKFYGRKKMTQDDTTESRINK